MALKEKDKQKWEEALKKLELMEDNDEVEDAVMGNSRSMMSWDRVILYLPKNGLFLAAEVLFQPVISV